MTRETDTNAKIVMLMKAALAETKHCRNEQQRQEFHIGLSYVMPPREGERSSKGWIRPLFPSQLQPTRLRHQAVGNPVPAIRI